LQTDVLHYLCVNNVVLKLTTNKLQSVPQSYRSEKVTVYDGNDTEQGHGLLPRCMKCRRGLAIRILSSVCPSVRPSVCLSVKREDCDKTKKTLLPEILGQPAPAGAKSPILNRYSLIAPQSQ